MQTETSHSLSKN